MAYEVVMLYHLHRPSCFLGTFTEYPRRRPFRSGLALNKSGRGPKTIQAWPFLDRKPRLNLFPSFSLQIIYLFRSQSQCKQSKPPLSARLPQREAEPTLFHDNPPSPAVHTLSPLFPWYMR